MLIEIASESPDHVWLHSCDAAGTAHRIEFFATVCPNPRCQCEFLTLHAFSAEGGEDAQEAAHPLRFTFELDKALITFAEAPSAISDEAEALLAYARAHIAAREWRTLREMFLRLKREQTERVDLDTVDCWFPPEIAEEGAMVGYSEIFPFCGEVLVWVDGLEYVLNDQYCVQRQCDCSGAAFSLYPSSDGEGERMVGKEAACTFYYNWKTGHYKPIDSPVVALLSIDTCVEALTVALTDLKAFARSRQERLAHVFKRHLRERMPHEPIQRAAPKIGRNAPCPCGSGQKYKRCCGLSSNP